jgi:hypothetical protein
MTPASQRERRVLPDWWRNHPAPPPHPDAPQAVRLAWLRRFLRPTADCEFPQEMLGYLDPCEGQCEVLLAGGGIAREVGFSAQEGWLAARLEWERAEREYLRFSENLRRRLWPMARARLPGAEILAVGRQVVLEYEGFVSEEQLLDLARRIAHAASPTRRPRRGPR